ncbi:spore germination protein [Clostridium aestuarii]|uniref:Spore germination protein n=1 Tax=Clostridium aestuarii TaxID=338193 RepID=A0ABT4D1R8_9CLOT|nr:spore germination protein [Clostridium aestuarii]MCY6485189.1 spore germination protein [Clostridium aestuarii]
MYDKFKMNHYSKISNNVKKSEFSKSLQENINLFKQEIFKDDETVIYRYFRNKEKDMQFCLIFVDGMADGKIINDNILKPIIYTSMKENLEYNEILDYIMQNVLITDEIKKIYDITTAIDFILYGDALLLIDGIDEIICIDAKGWETRAISEPLSETVIRGPREGFTECMSVNVSLIRRKINSNKLKFKFRELGTVTKTKICICYIDDLVSKQILNELYKRLDKIKIDGILESGYIEELIKDHPASTFKTIGNSERPDAVAGMLLEGKIALICDGTPFVLTIPFVFQEYFQNSEDYYNNFIYGSFNRLLRILGFMLTTSVPAIYVALTTFHQEMIPTQLMLSIAAAVEGVPFPPAIEAVMMLTTFEILREAGTRLPKNIGQAVSIVGALVLGEAAASANIVSAPMVIVVGITGISSFLIPKMLGPVVIIRIICLILASILGLYGYIFAVIGISFYLFSLKSFGVDYMLKIGSINKLDLKDTAIRAPWWFTENNPKFVFSKLVNKYKGSR